MAQRAQIASETTKEVKLETKWVSCDCDAEKCEPNCKASKDLESLASEKDFDQQHRLENSCSFFHAVVNMLGMLIGLGQLSTPYALENGGWISSFLLLALGVTCAYTCLLLGKCLEKNPNLRVYKDIRHHAFGTKGRALAASFIYMEIFMALVSYTISLHDNLAMVFLGTQLKLPWTSLSTPQILTTIAVLVALPSLWLRDLSSISFLSTGGILMSILIFLMVVCTAIFGGVKATYKIPALQIRNIPAISGLYMFSYAGHIVFPNLYTAMRDPSKFTKVSIVSFTSVTLLYISLAFMGAKMFGPEIYSQITLSMPRNLIFTKIALGATVITPMTKYTLEFTPFAIQLEQNLPHTMKPRTKMVIRCGVGSIFLLAILVLALSVPYFEHILSLTGSLVSVGIRVIFPCVFYMKIFWAKLSKPLVIVNGIVVIVAGLLAAFGTISSSRLLLNNIRRVHTA